MSEAINISVDGIDAAISEVREVGYTIIPDFVDQNRVAQLRELSEKLLQPIVAPGINGEKITGLNIKNVLRVSRDIDDLVTDPGLLAVMTSILVPDGSRWGINISGTGIKDAVPQEDIRALHRDGSLYPVYIPGQPLVANSLLAIDAFSPEVGATTIVPYSHLWDKPVELDHETIPVTMDPGSILIFNGNTWHGHGQNKTDRHRRTLNMLYCCDWLKPTHGYCSGIPDNEVKTLPQALQTLLGVNTKSPYSRQTTPY